MFWEVVISGVVNNITVKLYICNYWREIMFGYVRIRRDDLKVKDFNIYRRKYCGICQRLGKDYGLAYRMITSYDIVFLVLSLENFEEITQPVKFRCPMNPLKKINVNISEHVMKYAAFINYHLAILKLKDDVIDEKSFWKKLVLKIFMCNPRYNSIKSTFYEELTVISRLIEEVNSLERTRANFDILSNSFGKFFAEIFKVFFYYYKIDLPEAYTDFYSLCFNFGKWIYIMDAYDDYMEDNKDKDFNLLSSIMQEDNSPDKIKAHKKVYIINKMLLYKMRESYHEINWNKHSEIIYNMITVGCTDTYWSIVHTKYPKIESIMKYTNNNL